MNQVLSMLFPSSLGTIIYQKNSAKENFGQTFIGYMINTLLTNTITILFYYYICDINKFNFTNIFTLKYILISSIISIIIGLIMTVINKFLNLKVEVTKNEKKVQTKKNNKNNTKNNK